MNQDRKFLNVTYNIFYNMLPKRERYWKKVERKINALEMQGFLYKPQNSMDKEEGSYRNT